MTNTDLIARLPTIMRLYQEIVQLTNAENPEFDLLWEAEELMRRNLFIFTAEEHGLQRYERLLGITPQPGESWQARRNHVYVRWNKETPYTFRFLIGLLEALTNGNFEVNPNFHEYEMEILVFTTDSGIISDLAYILRNIIPANIALTSRNTINVNLKGFFFVAAIVNSIRHYTITQDYHAKYKINGRINRAAVVERTRHYTLVQGEDVAVQTSSKISIGSSVVQSKSITISNAFNAEISTQAQISAAGSVVKVIEYKI